MQKVAKTSSTRSTIQSRVPRYVQIASVLRQRLQDGYWSVGNKISTIEALEREFDVARVTIRQAIDVLQNEGLLKSHQGRGTFVTGSPTSSRWLQLATDWEKLVAPIRKNVPEFLPVAKTLAPVIDPNDGVAAPDYVFLKSIQRKDGQPYALAHVHIAKQVHAMAPRRFSTGVALVVLAGLKSANIARAHQTLVIGAADVEAADVLDIPLGSPIALARCVVTDDTGVVIYVGEITYPGDLVRINIELFDESGD